jgi:catechol 2,3-dioxygenase-like lactoylglutathione lyase family enzyme
MRVTRPFVAVAAAAACGLLILASTAPTSGQATEGTGLILGTGAFTGFVEDMDRSLEFYHDAFGMDVPPRPAAGARAYNPTNAQLFAMFDIPGARERHQSASVPDTSVRVELMEIQDVPHATVPLRVQDPGAATLVFIVGDLDTLLARARGAGATVVTPGGRPVPLAGDSRAVLLRDLDGRFVELRQAAAGTDAVSGIQDMRLSIAVADMTRTAHVYRDVLGFALEGETAWAADPQVRALTGLPTVETRRSRAHVEGSPLRIEFVEYRGVDRTPLRMRIQDRGAARLQLRARDVDTVVEAMRQAGLRVMSQGGDAVPIPPNFKGALVADPDNFFLTPFAPCDGCAPTLRRE